MLLQLLQNLWSFTTIYAATALVLLFTIASFGAIWNGNNATTRRQLRHLRRVGVAANSSNMADQYDAKFNVAADATGNVPVRIKSLYVYPVKSCGPIELDRALLTKTGFLYDRCFALATTVDAGKASEWRFISQRTKPSMSLVQTEMWLPHKSSDPSNPLVLAGGCLVLTFPDLDPPSWPTWLEALFYNWGFPKTPQVSFIVPLSPIPAQQEKYNLKLKTFAIHSRDARGLDMGGIPAVAAALPKLRKFLEIKENVGFTLLRCTPDTLVRTDKNLAPLEYIGTPAVHGYTDQQPIHINNLASVHAVSELLPSQQQPLNALRFRANIWITGAPAYEEDNWKRYRVLPKGTLQIRERSDQAAAVFPTLSVVCRTSRCTMPNVDPDKGVFCAEEPPPGKKIGKAQPSTTLIEHRTPETGNKAAMGYIGMHCVPEDSSLGEPTKQEAGVYIQVGDEIQVLERGVHLYGSTGNDY